MIGFVARDAGVLEDRVGEAVGVALGREIALELGDEQAAVREDQDPEPPGRLDEAGRGDRLPGSRRMAEAIAADGPRVGAVEALLELLLVDEAGVEVVVRLLVEVGLGDGASFPLPFPPFPFSSAARCVEAMSSASIPASASTWWRRSSVPAAVRGRSSVRTRSSPSMRP